MGPFIFGVILFIVLCIGFSIAGGLLYLTYLPFKKWLIRNGKLTNKRSGQINRAYVGLIALLAFFTTWTAFFPLDSFYKDEFKYNTGLEFPVSGTIIAKASEYPDLHGDYWASAIIEVKEDDYQTLKKQISQRANFSLDTTNQKIGITTEYDKLTNNINEGEIEVVYSNMEKQWFKVAFLKDRKTIIFERNSS